MADSIKVAVLGGSGVATPELIDTLSRYPERPAVHVALIGRSEDKLKSVAAMCERLAAKATPSITVSAHTDPNAGLDGADYILNQIRVGGYKERAYDETFPRQFGVPGEETVGPGGMNMALRTIPVVLELCEAVEHVAPDALFINLTNPSSMVQYAIQCASRLNVISVCDLPIMAERMIAAALNAPIEELAIRYTGMNHFGWVTSVRWHGQDQMPALMDKVADLPGVTIEPDIVRALGVLPTSYFKFIYHSNRVLESQQGKRARADELLELEAEILKAYESGDLSEKPDSLVKRSAAWYDHMIVPVLLAHANDTGETRYLQVTNGHAVPFMPSQSIIEVPCIIRRSGILPLAYDGGLPPDLESMLLANATFEMLWVDAIMERSYAKALRAMLINPLISNYDQAKTLLDTIWH